MKNDYEVCPNCGSHIPAGTAVCPYCQYVIYQDDDDIELPSLKTNAHVSKQQKKQRHGNDDAAFYPKHAATHQQYEYRDTVPFPSDPEPEKTNTFSELHFEDIQDNDDEKLYTSGNSDDYEYVKPPVAKREKKESAGKYIILFVVLLVVFCGTGYVGVNLLTGKGIPFLPKETAEPVKQTVSTPASTLTPSPTPTPEVTATPEPTVLPSAEPEATDDSSIGTVDILADSVRERATADTDGAVVGMALAGEQYTVYEEYNDGVYTWYRIGENVWVPTDGTWMTFTGR